MWKAWMVSVLILSAFAGLSSRAPAAGDRATVTFEVGEGVSAEDEATVRQGVQFAQDFLAAHLGGDVRGAVVVALRDVPDDTEPNSGREHHVSINTWHFRGEAPLRLWRSTIHEYYHVWQGDVSGLKVGGAPWYLDELDRPLRERVLAALLSGVGEQAFADAWSQGRAMRLEHAVASAVAATA